LTNQGTKIIQILIQNLEINYKLEIFEEIITYGFLDLIKNCNGYHILVCFLQEFQKYSTKYTTFVQDENRSKEYYLNKIKEHKKFIDSNIKVKFVEICKDKYGCSFIQFYFSIIPQKSKIKFLFMIRLYSKIFITHPYANYIIQYIIDRNDSLKENDFFLELIKNDFINLCNNKSSSNIIEKLLENYDNCENLIETVIKDESNIVNVLLNPFGNYGKLS